MRRVFGKWTTWIAMTFQDKVKVCMIGVVMSHLGESDHSPKAVANCKCRKVAPRCVHLSGTLTQGDGVCEETEEARW